jgi:SAM-dependent methyltransferase
MFQDLTTFTNDYPARLVECESCGVVSRDPRFSPSAAIEAYAKDDYHPDWLESTFQEYYASFRSQMPRLVQQIGRQARVLEVGSYVGGFLAAARDYGWQAQGVDVGKRVSDFVRSKGLPVLTRTLLDARLPDRTFDAVFVWVCFDQLPDPWAELAEIHRVLMSKGWLMLQVPNGDFIKWVEPLARRIGWHPLHESIVKTLAYTGLAGFHFQTGYTPASLRHILGASGFEGITVRNRINLADAQECKHFSIPEQGVFLSRIQWASGALARASLGKAVKGPWIQVACRKLESRLTHDS